MPGHESSHAPYGAIRGRARHPRFAGPVPPYSAPPDRPGKPRWPWIVGAVVAVAVVLLAVGGYAVIRGSMSESQERVVTVTYEITGNPGSVEVRYHNSDGHLSAPEVVTLPWQTQVTAREGAKQLLSVSGERADSSNEPLACRITSDGTSIDGKRSAGRFVFCGGYIGGD